MHNHLTSIKEQLRAEETRLDKIADTQKQELRSSESQLKRIRSALRELDGKAAGNPSSRRASSKSAASKAEVREIVRSILEQGQSVELQGLKNLIEQHIQKMGKSRIGLALRLKEVLAENLFEVTPGGIVLASAIDANHARLEPKSMP